GVFFAHFQSWDIKRIVRRKKAVRNPFYFFWFIIFIIVILRGDVFSFLRFHIGNERSPVLQLLLIPFICKDVPIIIYAVIVGDKARHPEFVIGKFYLPISVFFAVVVDKSVGNCFLCSWF